jgi:predicted PurR-regulated permease PerM
MSFPSPTEKQAQVIWLAVTGLAIAVILGLVVGAVWGLGHVLNVLAPVVWPLAVAGVVACLLDPVVGFLTRRKVPRLRAIVVVFVLALAIVGAVGASIVPQLVVQSRELATRTSELATQLPEKVAQLAANPPSWLPKQGTELIKSLSTLGKGSGTNEVVAVFPAEVVTNQAVLVAAPVEGGDSFNSVVNYVTRLLPRFGSWLRDVLGFFGTVFGVIAGLALVPIYAFYFLLEKHGISEHWTIYLPMHDSKFKNEVVFIISSIQEYLVAFFRGQVLVAICDGVLYTIGFIAIGLPYALLLGVMATCLTIIPFLGAITTCVSALVIAVVAFGDWQHPALVVGVFAIVQSLEGLVIQPKIMGDRVGLHPVTIIIALMVGTTLLGGILGGILAIPLAAALRVLMFRYIWKRRVEA